MKFAAPAAACLVILKNNIPVSGAFNNDCSSIDAFQSDNINRFN